MTCRIIIRTAKPGDLAARDEIIRQGITSHSKEAFILFFFQELTLQCSVLCSAVLFIFFGISVYGLIMVVPIAAAVVGLCVYVAHTVLADKHVQAIRKELFGFVAELNSPYLIDTNSKKPDFSIEHELFHSINEKPVHKQIVGTASVSEFWGPESSGWLHGLCVLKNWQKCGVGKSLASRCRKQSNSAGLAEIHAVCSELQHSARALLQQSGWECNGTYHRQLLGPALTLQLAHLHVSMPQA